VLDANEELMNSSSLEPLGGFLPSLAGDDRDGEESLDLSGTGRHFVWLNLPSVFSLIASIFLLSYSVRKIGAVSYGGVVTISSTIAVLTLFSGALRYAVVRSGARLKDRSETDSPATAPDAVAVLAAHSILMAVAIATLVIGVALGWLIPLDLHMGGATALQTYVAAIVYVGASCVGIAVMSYSAVLTGREQFGTVAKIALVGILVQVGGTLLLVDHYRIIGLALAALAAALVEACLTYGLGRERCPWLSLIPHLPERSAALGVLRYAAGLAILSATATICASSDAFIIGAFKNGAAVTVFKVGVVAPTGLVVFLYSSFAVLFPRLARSGSRGRQEDAVGWMGRVTGWFAGWMFASLCLLSNDVVKLFLGHSNPQASQVLWICSGALMVDASYHGIIQVVYARGQQSFLARYSWIELLFNLGATCVLVREFGPVGSAWALAATIALTDLIGFPIIMKRHWSSPAGRFVIRHGVLQSLAAAALTTAVGIGPFAVTKGLPVHLAILAGTGIVVLATGMLVAGGRNRSEMLRLVKV
jgi:O-antigen/teichoic acid export membrane protein